MADTYREVPTMATIPLTQGLVALVDEADVEWLSQWKWCACQSQRRKYVAVRSGRHGRLKRLVYMHRQILGLAPGDGLEADHINHDPLDNRRENLRVVSPGENKRWVAGRGGSSQYVGVTWDASRDCWRAQIQVDGVGTNLGRYATEREAAEARDRFVLANNTGHELNLLKGP